MSGDARFPHSKTLFTTVEGGPIRFYMKPCSTRTRLRDLIEYGGGLISSKLFGDSIRLISPEHMFFEGVCYTSKYIDDCVAADRLLELDKYKPVEVMRVDDDGEDDDDFNVVNTKSRAPKRSRRSYTFADDLEILKDIFRMRQFGCYKGNSMWKKMENRRVMTVKRSWQSLKERFIKSILPNLGQYPLSTEEIKYFKNVVAGNIDDGMSSDDTSIGSTRRPYTRAEDRRILEYIIEKRVLDDSKGNRIWNNMERIKLTAHSGQSMKERFRKQIVFNLGNFSISETHRKDIEDFYGISPETESGIKSSSRPFSRETTPDSTIFRPRKKIIVNEDAGPSTRTTYSRARKIFLASTKTVPLLIEASPERNRSSASRLEPSLLERDVAPPDDVQMRDTEVQEPSIFEDDVPVDSCEVVLSGDWKLLDKAPGEYLDELQEDESNIDRITEVLVEPCQSQVQSPIIEGSKERRLSGSALQAQTDDATKINIDGGGGNDETSAMRRPEELEQKNNERMPKPILPRQSHAQDEADRDLWEHLLSDFGVQMEKDFDSWMAGFGKHSPRCAVSDRVEGTKTKTSVAQVSQSSPAVDEMGEAAAPFVETSIDESSEEDLPDAVKRMLDGCALLTAEDKFHIIRWSGENLNLTMKNLLRYHKLFVRHGLDKFCQELLASKTSERMGKICSTI